MNPIDIIKKDHREVEALFKEYEGLGDTAYAHKKEVVDKIIAALELHAEMEETIFYPKCKDAFNNEEDKMVEEAFAEHDVAKNLMAEIQALAPEDEQFHAKVTVLAENIKHHVGEEEKELLPQAEKEISEEDMNALGEEMAAFKENAV